MSHEENLTQKQVALFLELLRVDLEAYESRAPALEHYFEPESPRSFYFSDDDFAIHLQLDLLTSEEMTGFVNHLDVCKFCAVQFVSLVFKGAITLADTSTLNDKVRQIYHSKLGQFDDSSTDESAD